MKRCLLFFCLSIYCLFGQAQWSTSGSNVYTTTSTSNVGIGTSSPQELLHVTSGATYPRAIVQSTNSNGFPGFAIADNNGVEQWTWHYSIPGQFTAFFLAGVGNVLVMTNSGNVGIGTTNPYNYRLAVNGSAIFTSAWVKPFANWPDYVFKKGYELPTLESVSKYICSHGHLPGMPSADSVQRTGLDLGGNQAALLRKIEELTLYAIEQEKSIQGYNNVILEWREKLSLQEQQRRALEERITRLEALIDKKSKN
jgi:hypothetical protein